MTAERGPIQGQSLQELVDQADNFASQTRNYTVLYERLGTDEGPEIFNPNSASGILGQVNILQRVARVKILLRDGVIPEFKQHEEEFMSGVQQTVTTLVGAAVEALKEQVDAHLIDSRELTSL